MRAKLVQLFQLPAQNRRLVLFCILGTKSVEYKNKVWHEDCFKCFECRLPIRTQSFLTKGDDIYCTSCNDKKFAKKCFHCKQVKAPAGWPASGCQRADAPAAALYSVNT